MIFYLSSVGFFTLPLIDTALCLRALIDPCTTHRHSLSHRHCLSSTASLSQQHPSHIDTALPLVAPVAPTSTAALSLPLLSLTSTAASSLPLLSLSQQHPSLTSTAASLSSSLPLLLSLSRGPSERSLVAPRTLSRGFDPLLPPCCPLKAPQIAV